MSEDVASAFGLVSLGLLIGYRFLVKRLVLRHARRTMEESSDETGSPGLAELQSREVPAPLPLRFRQLDASTISRRIVETREKFVAGARTHLRSTLWTEAKACLGYATLPVLATWLVGGNPESLAAASGFAVFQALYLGLAVLRYAFYRQRFRPAEQGFGFNDISTVGGMVRVILSPDGRPLLGGFWALLNAFVGWVFLAGGEAPDDMGLGLGMLAAAVLHLVLMYRQIRGTPDKPNLQLMLLRVFGVDENAELTFGRIAIFWRHFGNLFTIADLSSLRHRYRFWSLRSAGFVLVSLVVTTLFLTLALPPIIRHTPLPESWLDTQGFAVWPVEVAFLPLAVLLYLPVYTAFFFRRIGSRIIRDHQHLDGLLGRLDRRPRTLGLSFKRLHALCHDNTWEFTVAALARRAVVVLMDLRGFEAGPQLRGCEYEIDFLFDALSVERLLFVVGSTDDQEAVRQTIRDRWELLRKSSPNLESPSPRATIYIAEEGGPADAQAILDLLMTAAVSE